MILQTFRCLENEGENENLKYEGHMESNAHSSM